MLVVANLVWNYSPFLAPTTRSARPTVELRRVLGIAAHDMLEQFLRKWRRVRGDSSTPDVRAVRYLRLSGFRASGYVPNLRSPVDSRHSARKVVRGRREND
jgi:hypothetical protein